MNAINRPYISEMRRYNLINDILRYFRIKIREEHISINPLKPQHLKYLSSYTQHDIDELEQRLRVLRDRVEHLCKTKEKLEKQEISLTEERWVHEKFDSLLRNVLLASQKALFNQLTEIAGSLEEWYAIIMKERHIYHILNRCKKSQYLKGGIILRAWITAYDMDTLQEIVDDIRTNIDRNTLPIINELDMEGEEPPTRQETNKFTEGFQNLIDSYGIAKYQEVNPGIFAITTFPFLFAIMFGDSGHGVLMSLFGLTMILLERRLSQTRLNDIVEILFSGRYIIFMMGLFSIFTGLIYNDCFSKSFVFSFKNSAYKFVEKPGITNEFVETKGFKEQGKSFLYGMDPGWIDASNSIIFMNSFKMKMSIIIGIVQMSFGVCLNVVNDIYFNNRINIFCEFIPEIIMLNSLFGYLCLLIIKKWLTDWTGASAPSLLNILINMVLKPGQVKPDEHMYFGQSLVQFILLILFVVCIFWLLLAKPYVIFAERNPHHKWSKWRYLPFFTESKWFGDGGGVHGEETERLMGTQYNETYDPLLGNEDDDEEEDYRNEQNQNEEDNTNQDEDNNASEESSNTMSAIIVEEFLPRRQKEERPFIIKFYYYY
ncbi:hypothetical protein PIROE2DRAFT_57009 [Piromyces sp. E2]|nr:hypothetical protein PIROE2DRAFT_57009 [Piromyces sp. E2]|eukprot:OUM70143.1 hypothetical protein PIROE2DRAFT_57009 [Piromyces sp. E2]